MENTKRTLFWLIPAALLFAAGFAVAAEWDLAITAGLYNPENLVAKLFEAFGWLPAFLPTVLLAMLWAAEGRANGLKRWRFPLGTLLAASGLMALYYVCYGYLEKRGLAAGASDVRTWLWLAVGILAAGLAYWWVLRQKAAMRYKLYFFSLAASVYMMANELVVNVVKNIWQRTRFDDMVTGHVAGGLSLFTPWYQLPGNGGSSFPSGHTANACGVFALIILCDIFPAWNRRRKLVYGACWAYVALMALLRVVIGRHFLSDTLAAAVLVVLLLFALRRTKWYKRGILNVRSIPKGLADKNGEENSGI